MVIWHPLPLKCPRGLYTTPHHKSKNPVKNRLSSWSWPFKTTQRSRNEWPDFKVSLHWGDPKSEKVAWSGHILRHPKQNHQAINKKNLDQKREDPSKSTQQFQYTDLRQSHLLFWPQVRVERTVLQDGQLAAQRNKYWSLNFLRILMIFCNQNFCDYRLFSYWKRPKCGFFRVKIA